MLAKAHKAAGARLCRAFALALFALPAWGAGFDSPLRSVAWAAMSDGARAAVVLGCVVTPAVMLCLLAAGGRKERRLGIAMLALLGAVLAWPAGAATKWVCGVGQGAADGSSPANCYNGWTFPDNTFAAGDELRVVGRVEKATTMLFTDAGVSGNPIRIIGEPGTQATLSGMGTADPVLQLGDSGKAASYVIVGDPERPHDLAVEDSNPTTGECIIDSSLGAGGGFNEFYVDTRRCGTYNILLQKPSPTVAYGSHSYCGDDCIGATAGAISPTIRANTIEYFSRRTLTGDGIFVNNAAVASNPVVEENWIYWDNAEGRALEKQGMIVGVASGVLTVRGNRLIARTPTATNHAIAITAATTANVERNFCSGWNACVTHFSDSAEGIDGVMSVNANVASGSQYLALIAASVGTPRFDVINNAGSGLQNGVRATATVSADLRHYNNTITLDGSGGDALYVSASLNSYAGAANNLRPEGASFIENYECGGGAYSTIAAYVAACTQEVGTNSNDPKFIGGPNPTTAEGFRPSATSPLIGAGAATGTVQDFFGDTYYATPDIGAFRRDSCYRRSRDGKLDMARTRSQVVSRCLGVPGRYPEGL